MHSHQTWNITPLYSSLFSRTDSGIPYLCATSIFFFMLVVWDQVPCTAATSGLLYQPQMIGEGDCGAIGGMKIGGGNRSTRRKPDPAVGSQQLTAWAIARPLFQTYFLYRLPRSFLVFQQLFFPRIFSTFP
jgi:hypothetical protein